MGLSALVQLGSSDKTSEEKRKPIKIIVRCVSPKMFEEEREPVRLPSSLPLFQPIASSLSRPLAGGRRGPQGLGCAGGCISFAAFWTD